MRGHVFFIVDVFAEKKFTGNQLAVFCNGWQYSDREMLDLTREMNYSESTFILSEKPSFNGYPVRIFTPEEELPFAGHPTLGTAFVIATEILKKKIECLHLDLKVGSIPVSLSYTNDSLERLWMRQIEPLFGEIIDAEIVSRILHLETNDLDLRFPIQEVSTGLNVLIVPLKTLASVRNIQVNRKLFYEFVEHRSAKDILVFCPQTYHDQHDINVRVFSHYQAIPEDPATGSANGCLAGYLARYRFFGSDSVDISVEQGYEIHRPSVLYLKSKDTKGRIEVNVGGNVIKVAKGRLAR
ncbi:PhzF family phenazine biosynthesis protein [bacterium]|nr:PhzF family phenazine biosynthesis protein [candidate division CSSED10-310 bacterium]